MRERERRKLAGEIVESFWSFAGWYGKPFRELLYENLERDKKLCRITISSSEGFLRFILSSSIDGYISYGRAHKRMELECWSRCYGVWLRVQDSFEDIISIRWLRSEELIVVSCRGYSEGIDINSDGVIADVMEVYDEE